MKSRLIVCMLAATWAVSAPAADQRAPLGLTEAAKGPWWMAETATTASGGLRLDSKLWWAKAKGLNVDEQFAAEGNRSLVRRETFKDRSGKLQDAIVWVIDDDEDGSAANGGDRDSDCYVADYGRDGLVDRMVDYIDDDGDQDPDEMDIRYFVDGELRYCWFGADLDDDSAMWSLAGYEYGGDSFFESDPYGDSIIYMNKLNTDTGGWAPISECPFAFYDTDADGQSEVVIRCSAVPLSYDPNKDPDYANDYGNFAAPWKAPLADMGITNVRYSFDVDGGSTKETPLHYDFGFNLVGSVPYRYPGMEHFNAKRRPPQVTIVTPWKDLREICDRFPARETGFSWHEQYDDTIAIGLGPQAEQDRRWEGVFWLWERRFMENTGGPGQKWNVRREYSAKPSGERILYYSPVDRRIHLKHAKEGWLQVGHFAGLDAVGEVRMFDTDDNGYFDRWECDFGDWHRVAQVADERSEDLPQDYEALGKRYVETILPAAAAANDRLMKAMSVLRTYQPDARLVAAVSKDSPNFRRYAQDVLLELQYADFHTHWRRVAAAALDAQPMDDLRRLNGTARASGCTSQTAWDLRRLLSQLDNLYCRGDLDSAAQLLDASGPVFKIPESECAKK